jgi:hypothetical protein
MDDLIEFRGDIQDTVSHEYTDERAPSLLAFSDGTILLIHFDEEGSEWHIQCVHKGALFDRIQSNLDKQDTEVAHFRDGLKWAYAARDAEKVR